MHEYGYRVVVSLGSEVEGGNEVGENDPYLRRRWGLFH